MTDLSPTAQKVLDAFDLVSGGYYDDAAGVWVPRIRRQLAAALRTAADQVAPEDYQYSIDINSDEDGGWVNGLESRNQEIRDALLTIAAELETFTTKNND